MIYSQIPSLELLSIVHSNRLHARVLCTVIRVFNHSPFRSLPLLQLPCDQRRDDECRINAAESDPTLIVSGSVDLLEHDQWQPGGNDVAELVHRGDDDGTLFIVRTCDLVGPTVWAILAVTLLVWVENLRKEETSSRSTHATEKETCPFPAVTDVPNGQ
jgi:hypothetical protein